VPAPDSGSATTERSPTLRGVGYALAAFLWWGGQPVYFKAVAAVSPVEVLAHRILWSFVLLTGWLALRGRFASVRAVLHDRRTLATLAVTTLLVTVNWFVFIWAVVNAHLVEASLGYFINPLVNVVLGLVFLGERLRPLQWLSVALAAAGVAILTVRLGQVPLVALTLAFSFGFYGLLRKTAAVDGPVGLTVETGLLTPFALLFLIGRELAGSLAFAHVGTGMTFLLLGAGATTALPLIWFVAGARLLPLSTLGFLQYLAPSGQFLLGVAVYDEPFTPAHKVSFGIIWTALVLFSWDLWRHNRAVVRRAAGVR
jgi:chloramphenicol-sensitive protein RarD